MTFNQPLPEFSDLVLVEIIEEGTDAYQQEYIDLARKELERRKLSETEYVRLINEYYGTTYIDQYRQEQTWKQQREANKTERYTIAEMALILLLSPLILLNRYYQSRDTLFSLWDENYKIKFWQRLFCLTAGVCFWYFVLHVCF